VRLAAARDRVEHHIHAAVVVVDAPERVPRRTVADDCTRDLHSKVVAVEHFVVGGTVVVVGEYDNRVVESHRRMNVESEAQIHVGVAGAAVVRDVEGNLVVVAAAVVAAEDHSPGAAGAVVFHLVVLLLCVGCSIASNSHRLSSNPVPHYCRS
jgi:hypothetical protein